MAKSSNTQKVVYHHLPLFGKVYSHPLRKESTLKKTLNCFHMNMTLTQIYLIVQLCFSPHVAQILQHDTSIFV